MPPRARIYLHCIVGTGLFLLIDGLTQFDPKDLRRFVAYLALALISATWKFKVPGMPATFSAGFAFVLIGIANFSLGEAMAMGCGSIVVQCLWRTPQKRPVRKVFFNVAAVAFGITLAYNPAHFELAGGLQKAPGMLSLAALLYFVVNTGLVSGMVALIEEAEFRAVWRRLAGYGLAYYLAGGVIASAIIVANRLWGWQAGLFILPLLYLTYCGYRAYLRSRGVLTQV
ncbi:MAG TPA: hypothetical protein VEU96_23160 [Bryobacteraceae bacterium]|nr:hypothetical protein [Bryobacteraceae bacterium]